jgi:hypothetical protein
MNNFVQNYEIILKHLQSLNVSFDSFLQIRKPKLSNLELIVMNLTAEFMGYILNVNFLGIFRTPF